MSSLRSLFVVCVVGLLAGLAGASEKPWIEVRSPHFRVLTDSSAGDARHVAHEFEQMRAVLAAEFPKFRLETGAPLLIFAVRDEASAKRLAPNLWKIKGAKPAGFFQHGWEKRFALVRLDQIQPGAYQVVYHEYTHTVLHANFRWLPTWLDEGMAEFYGNTRFEHDKIVIGAPSLRFNRLQGPGALIPIDTLLAVNQRSPYYHDEDKVDRFYAESWALVHFLELSPGMINSGKLSQFNSLLQQGMEQKKAFQQVYGDTATLQKNFERYVDRLAVAAAVFPNPPKIEEKDFSSRTLSMAETETELGGYHLWSRDYTDARPLLERAVEDDPKLGVAHENMGFLNFNEGKDKEALAEFSQAYDLDPTLYLSLFYKTMLSPVAHSDAVADQANLHDALLKTLDLNRQFAPAYIELSRMDLRQGKTSDAFAVSRRAEQLEPSRAGYHIWSGQILLRMNRATDASDFARFVAERWVGSDHNEAVELWNRIPAGQRGPGDPLNFEVPKDTQTAPANCVRSPAIRTRDSR